MVIGPHHVEPMVLGIAGGIASGKTSISRAVASALAWNWASFGDEVRRIANEQGLDVADRQVLREIGQALVEKDSDAFCRAVLAQGRWERNIGIVLDGVRHTSIVEALRRVANPAAVRLVVIDTPDAIRSARLRARREEGISELPMTILNQHATEREVSRSLPDLADLIVDGTSEPARIVQHITRWLSDNAG